MENKGTDFSEEWIKIKKDDIPEGEYILEDFRKDEKENPLVKDVLSLLLGK